MSKTMLVLATIAMLGLSSAAFAENAVPAMKEGAQLTHTQASVIHKRRLSHRVGARKFDVAYHHNPHYQVRQASHQANSNGKKSLPKHASANRKMRTKASS
jgi:2-polyprenyl-3-methyl-5-hydroxy-6-metoxy-1,4-benzoquinol methylase